MPAAALGRLRKRSEFLAVAAANLRSTTPGVALQALFPANGPDGNLTASEPSLRVGFTATRKIGNAVKRNRARRRLRAVARQILAGQTAAADIVLVARPGTLVRPYDELKNDLRAALIRVGIRP